MLVFRGVTTSQKNLGSRTESCSKLLAGDKVFSNPFAASASSASGGDGRSSKHLLQNGGFSWWFIIDDRNKSHLKQIQVKTSDSIWLDSDKKRTAPKKFYQAPKKLWPVLNPQPVENLFVIEKETPWKLAAGN